GLADGFPTALNADPLHRVGGVAQAGGVNDVQRDAVQCNLLDHPVAGGAGNVRDDGGFKTGQRVQQAGFTDVGLARQHDVQAFAQDGALFGVAHEVVEVGADAVEHRAGLVFFEEINFLFGEVERGFNQHPQVDDTVGQFIDGLRKRARHRGGGAAGGGFGGGVDQVGHGFSLGQVEAVVEEGAAGEFAGLGQPEAGAFSGFQATREQPSQDDGAAVALQFQHVFARVGVRRGGGDRKTLVDQRAIGVEKWQVVGVPRPQGPADQCLREGVERLGGGDSHNADAAPAGSGGDGDNRVCVQVHDRI